MGLGVLVRTMMGRRVAGSPYERICRGGGEWIDESRSRQVFEPVLETGESPVMICPVTVVLGGASDRAVPGLAAVTRRALHLRLRLGPGIHQPLRVGHGEVRGVEQGADGELHITYFDPRRAVPGSWHQVVRLVEAEGARAGSTELAATLTRMVDEYADHAGAAPAREQRHTAVTRLPAGDPVRVPYARIEPGVPARSGRRRRRALTS